jgi:hypothetical protein
MTTMRVDSMNMKKIILALFALVIAFTAISFASAYGSDDPYSYQNLQYAQVGKMWQSQQTVYYGYEDRYNYYDYVAPARTGGWFGSGTEWLVGLRPGQPSMLPPVRYTNYYQRACGWPCYTGGYGYPRARASDFPYRTRYGGVFSY